LGKKLRGWGGFAERWCGIVREFLLSYLARGMLLGGSVGCLKRKKKGLKND
jgi:hypothetical protein